MTIYKGVFLVIFLIAVSPLKAQTLGADFEQSAGYTSPGLVPFWLRANNWGSVPSDKFSMGFTASIRKDYSGVKKLDWAVGFGTRLNLSIKSNINVIEAYAKIKISFFEFKGGRNNGIMGLCDSTLSAGSFSVSGNAPGIPGLHIGMTDYKSLPFLGNVLAFRFNYSHGLLGRTPVNLDQRRDLEKTWFHQKSFYGRFGKPDWKLKLYGGVNHQVFWGNEDSIFGINYTLSGSQTYFYVITGKKYETSNIEPSRIGNHLGSYDLGLEYDFGNWLLFVYRQNFYDFIAFKYLANISDGLNGVSITNKTGRKGFFRINKILAEFLYTRNQGEKFSLRDPTYYNENYYNNYIYSDGWSYKGYALGNPLLTTKNQVRAGLSDEEYDFFHNNMVSAIHLGIEGEAGKWNCSLRSTYSRNYGTHFSKFEKGVDQFSFFAEGRRTFREEKGMGIRTAFDKGGLLYDCWGFFLFLYQAF